VAASDVSSGGSSGKQRERVRVDLARGWEPLQLVGSQHNPPLPAFETLRALIIWWVADPRPVKSRACPT
jgi:hypothetical protein